MLAPLSYLGGRWDEESVGMVVAVEMSGNRKKSVMVIYKIFCKIIRFEQEHHSPERINIRHNSCGRLRWIRQRRSIMFKRRFSWLLVLLLILSSLATSVLAAKPDVAAGQIAYAHLEALADDIGARAAGSAQEAAAKDYIAEVFEDIGYATTVQEFSYVRRGTTYNSANVIAVKPGKSPKQVIVGAHYDSVSAGKGADDNASGVAVMLEAAENLKDVNLPYTVIFIAFGAEEVGLKGSQHYVAQMTPEEIASTVVMVNLDSLAVGDKMYVYGSAGKDGWYRDKALQIAKKLGLNLETNSGLNPDYPAGTTGDWSDHAPFKNAGIPYAYFEATNWELEPYDGYTQTELDGEIWHTAKDTVEYIEANYPGRIEEHLNTFVQVLEGLLQNCRNKA